MELSVGDRVMVMWGNDVDRGTVVEIGDNGFVHVKLDVLWPPPDAPPKFIWFDPINLMVMQ